MVVKKTELGTVEGLAGEITKVKDDGVRVARSGRRRLWFEGNSPNRRELQYLNTMKSFGRSAPGECNRSE